MLTKKDLEHLSELARLELKPGEEIKLQKDLGSILDYFEELRGLNTEKVEPLTGGTDLNNILREDKLVSNTEDDTGKGQEAFLDKQDGYLRVPPVF